MKTVYQHLAVTVFFWIVLSCSVQTTTEDTPAEKFYWKNCCHECLKHNLHLLQQNSSLTELSVKRRNK